MRELVTTEHYRELIGSIEKMKQIDFLSKNNNGLIDIDRALLLMIKTIRLTKRQSLRRFLLH